MVECQKLADTPLTSTRFLLLIPMKVFLTGISSFVLRLLAAASLEFCSLPRADYGQKQGILSFVLSSANPPHTFRMVHVLHQPSVAVRSLWPLPFMPRASGYHSGGREPMCGLYPMTLVPVAVLLLAQSEGPCSIHLFCCLCGLNKLSELLLENKFEILWPYRSLHSHLSPSTLFLSNRTNGVGHKWGGLE